MCACFVCACSTLKEQLVSDTVSLTELAASPFTFTSAVFAMATIQDTHTHRQIKEHRHTKLFVFQNCTKDAASFNIYFCVVKEEFVENVTLGTSQFLFYYSKLKWTLTKSDEKNTF